MSSAAVGYVGPQFDHALLAAEMKDPLSLDATDFIPGVASVTDLAKYVRACQ